MKKAVFVGLAVVVVVVIVIISAIALHSGGSDAPISFHTYCDNPTRSSDLGKYTHAAVSTDAVPCGDIAIDILKRNGTAADAAVAAMFCVGIVNAQSCGLGGGFLATYYSKAEGKVYALDAREVAPKSATPTMYNEKLNPHLKGSADKWYAKMPPNYKGGLSVAVPGEAAGLYELYRRFGGGLEWKDLLAPSIKLCEEGANLTWYTAGVLQLKEKDVLAEPTMSIFLDPSSGRLLREGEPVPRGQLARTLRQLQENPKSLSEGPLAKALVQDLASFGGIITEEDLREYRPLWRPPVTFPLSNGNYTLHSFPPPGSGLVFGLILALLNNMNLTEASLGPDQLFRTHHRVIEAFKYSYAKRQRMGDLSEEDARTLIEEVTSQSLVTSILANLTDEMTSSDPSHYGTRVVPGEDHGTAHLSLVAPNGDAVAITSSINMAYGAGIRSASTGLIFNNQMGDFTTDEQLGEAGAMDMDKNSIQPGKRPLSSMSPSIILDKDNNARLVLGAAGGSKIPSAMAWVAARHLWMGQDLKEAIDACRNYHTLIPMTVFYDKGFPKDILQSLKNRGHEVEEFPLKTVVNGIVKEGTGNIVANADYRKSGQVGGF